MQHLQLLLGDILAQLPTSSIDVERSHANTQVDVAAHKAVPKRPSSIQADAYTGAVSLDHSRLKKLIEDEVLGKAALRVKRTLRARRVETAAPGAGVALKRPNFNEDGTVRGRSGLLRGLLQHVQNQNREVVEDSRTVEYSRIDNNRTFRGWAPRSVKAGGVHRTGQKWRKVSPFNAFQKAQKCLSICIFCY